MGSGCGSGQTPFPQSLLLVYSVLSKEDLGKRMVDHTGCLNGMIEIEDVKNGRLESGLLSSDVVDLGLSAGAAWQARREQ